MIVPIALALVLVGMFAGAVWLLRIDRSTLVAWRECVSTGQVLRSAASDLEKERAARRAALTLGRLMLTIVGKLLLAAVLPVALMYLFDAVGVATIADLESALISMPVIVAGVLLTVAAFVFR